MWASYRRAFNNHVYKRQHERQIPDGRAARQASWKHTDTTRAPVPCCVILFCVNAQPDHSPLLLFLLLSMLMQHQIQVRKKKQTHFQPLNTRFLLLLYLLSKLLCPALIIQVFSAFCSCVAKRKLAPTKHFLVMMENELTPSIPPSPFCLSLFF